jgi:uncharacterized protein with HEPN domain
VKTDRLPDYLDHIIEGVIYIEEFVSGMTLADFEHDIKTQDAVIRRLEIIGDAAGSILRISPDFTADHPDMRLMAGIISRDEGLPHINK